MSSNPIKKWHQVVQEKNFELLESILDDSVVFYSPVVFTPQKGKKITLMYLSSVAMVFNVDSFSYTHEVIDGNIASLEFELELEGIHINGLDLITWNKDQKITEFKVFIRPLQGLNALHKMMGKALKQ
ncbi:nuclear transport factor 2 family protein [Woeseiaceae bacterium]|nr:nuclear transport factor 2 family protein [Woeseiaceae bacterium]